MLLAHWRSPSHILSGTRPTRATPRTPRRVFLAQAGLAAVGAALLPQVWPASAAISVPFLSQRSQPWAPDILGYNTDRKYTISDYGCVITALSMIFNYHRPGVTDPAPSIRR